PLLFSTLTNLPCATADHPVGTVTVTSYTASSEGVSLTGYQVEAPYGSCMVQASPRVATLRPSPSSKSPRSDGMGTVVGRPWYCTTSVVRASAASCLGTAMSSPAQEDVTSAPSTVTSSTVYESEKSSWTVL